MRLAVKTIKVVSFVISPGLLVHLGYCRCSARLVNDFDVVLKNKRGRSKHGIIVNDRAVRPSRYNIKPLRD